jgi:hypothetical protein
MPERAVRISKTAPHRTPASLPAMHPSQGADRRAGNLAGWPRRHNRMRLRLLVLLPLLALAACGDTPRREAAPDPEAGDCGSYVVTNADGADGLPGRAEQQRCLLDAFGAGDRARLDVELTTEEGDPIYYRYTVLGPRLVEVRTDTTHDAFGSPAVTTEQCVNLAVVDGYLTAESCGLS